MDILCCPRCHTAGVTPPRAALVACPKCGMMYQHPGPEPNSAQARIAASLESPPPEELPRWSLGWITSARILGYLYIILIPYLLFGSGENSGPGMVTVVFLILPLCWMLSICFVVYANRLQARRASGRTGLIVCALIAFAANTVGVGFQLIASAVDRSPGFFLICLIPAAYCTLLLVHLCSDAVRRAAVRP